MILAPHSGTREPDPRHASRAPLAAPTATWLALAAAVASLTTYLSSLAPGLTWAHDSADGGELAAAARTLGIPHPPGYPVYTLLAHLFTRVPLGEVATRTNVFSALCAAAAVAVTTWCVARRVSQPSAALAAGLALAFTPLLWSQAIVTEVHTLNGLFTALLLVMASKVDAGNRRLSRDTGLALALGCTWGLSLGNHPSAMFCGPLVAYGLAKLGGRPGRAQVSGSQARNDRGTGTKVRQSSVDREGDTVERTCGWVGSSARGQVWPVLAGTIGLVLGLAAYLYLPIRAVANPPINWGDPRTPARLWWMISGAPYRRFVFALPAAHLFGRLIAWASLLRAQFGAIGLLASALGVAALWTGRRGLLLSSGTTVALGSAFAVGYNTTDSYLYLIPSLICLAFWLGIGLDWLIVTVAAWRRQLAWVLITATLAFPLAAAVRRFPDLDLSADDTVASFLATALFAAPQNAIILSESDAHTFALWYAQHALGQRQDITVVDRGLLGFDWYAAQLAKRLAVPQIRGEAGITYAADDLGFPVCHIDRGDVQLLCAGP